MFKNNKDKLLDIIEKNRNLAITILIGIVAIIIIDITNNKNEIVNISEKVDKNAEYVEEQIIVYVAGEVNYPGVYKLKKGDRVVNAIEIAGDTTELAEILNVNLAKKISDGEKITIPSKNDMNLENDVLNSKVNINTATVVQLDSLPGIGVSTAQKIITYRENNGDFEDIEKLKDVPGIGESKYQAIKELIEV